MGLNIIGQEAFSDPVKYRWAVDKKKNTRANHWLAQEVPMGEDVHQWKTGVLTPDEMQIVKRNLGFFVTADSLAANNIVLGTSRHIAAKECVDFLKRQAYEEAIHTEAYVYIVESLGLDQGEIFNAYHEVPCIRAKDEFLLPYIEVLADTSFVADTLEKKQKLLRSIFAFAAIMEGLFFYVGFVQILALGRQNKLPGSSLQYRFILRDESLHCNFGLDMFNQIKLENPELFTPDLQAELAGMLKRGIELEYAYAEETMPRGVLGLNPSLFLTYLNFIGERRLRQAGVPTSLVFQPSMKFENPFPWMSDMLDLRTEAAFFETRSIEYRQGNDLEWE